MGSAALHKHILEQARGLFAAGAYEAACAVIPRCGMMLAPRYSVRHLAERLRSMRGVEELRTYVQTAATDKDRVIIAWAFVRVAETAGADGERTCQPLNVGAERLLRMDALQICQLGFWLHLIVWPEDYCPSSRSHDCGSCSLESPR